MGHTENRTIQVDVFTAGELWMKSTADLEKACHTAVDANSAFAWFGNARKNLEQRTLAGTIPSYDADDLAALHLEAHILERPEFLGRIAEYNRLAASEVQRRAREPPRRAR